MRKTPVVPFVLVGVALSLTLAWFTFRRVEPDVESVPIPASPVVVLTDQHDSLQPFMEGIFAADRDVDPPDGYRIRGVIVPHHLTASATIASGIRMLEHQGFKRIILLSPDHFNRCPTMLCTADAVFQTQFGDIRPATETLEILRASSLVTEEPNLFAREHGISAVAPFIAHYQPGIFVTPLVLSRRLPWRAEKDALLDLFAQATDEDTMLIVSSDFSHYLPLAAADEMDELTAEALFAKDLDGIASLQTPAQSDCPGCLWIMAALADEGGFYNPSVVMHTNSARILGDEKIAETTSHFSMVWYENAHLDGADLALAGDVTLTRGTPPALPDAVAAWWSGSGPRVVNLEGPIFETCAPRANPYLFCNEVQAWRQIRDLATHWGVMNNHMLDLGAGSPVETAGHLRAEGEAVITANPAEVGGWRIVALTTSMNPVPDAASARLTKTEEETLAALREGDTDVPTVVFVHGGEEYGALSADVDDARWERFIDAGADAVVVSHSHVPSDVRIYDGRPIFRGLGNFLFDQLDRAATFTAKLVRLRYDDGRVLFETLVAPIQ